MRTTITRLTTMVMAGVLTATAIAWFATPTLEPTAMNTPTPTVHMTYGAYASQRAFQGEEDMEGWDCRINGNGICGSTGFELICATDHPAFDTVCTLESHSVKL